MGYGSASSDDLTARAAFRKSTGTSYAYSAATAAAPSHLRAVHESLDPKRLNSLGEKIRECLDSTDHPLTVPVFVGFDETGSMGEGPRIIQDKLSTLKGATLRFGLDDVQLCFGAYGDADNGEVAPCQVGQFESGLEMEEWLNNLYLEGSGGGNGHETAGLLLWFLATHSRLDSVTKRNKKGYIFLTGDEISGPVTRQQVQKYVDEVIEDDIPMEEVVRMVSELYNVFFLLVDNSSARYQNSIPFWTKLLGNDNVIIVENLENISEQIAGILAFEEGVADDFNDVATALKAEGSTSTAIEAVSKSLSNYKGRTTAVATTQSGTLAAQTATAATERL